VAEIAYDQVNKVELKKKPAGGGGRKRASKDDS